MKSDTWHVRFLGMSYSMCFDQHRSTVDVANGRRAQRGLGTATWLALLGRARAFGGLRGAGLPQRCHRWGQSGQTRWGTGWLLLGESGHGRRRTNRVTKKRGHGLKLDKTCRTRCHGSWNDMEPAGEEHILLTIRRKTPTRLEKNSRQFVRNGCYFLVLPIPLESHHQLSSLWMFDYVGICEPLLGTAHTA